MRCSCLTGSALGLLLLAGCAPAPLPTPPDTRAADEKAIRDGEVAWNADFASKDVERVVSHYADDACVMFPEMTLLKGKDAIRGGFKPFLADPNMAISFAPASVEVAKAGDLAYSQGFYTLTLTNQKTKKPVTEKGKYVTVYRKVDGTWKAVQDINNADAPAK